MLRFIKLVIQKYFMSEAEMEKEIGDKTNSSNVAQLKAVIEIRDKIDFENEI